MIHKERRALAVSLKRLCIAVCTAIALCAGIASAKTRLVHLHDPSHGPDWRAWLEQAKADFEAQNPGIEIELWYPASRGEQQDRLIAMYATGSLPDVVEVIPSEYYRFALDGVFLPLNPFMDREESFGWDQFFPAAVEASRIIEAHPGGGNHWMLPVSVFTVGYVFNHQRFDEGGVVPPSFYQHHWTWEEALEVGRKLTVRDGEGNVTQYGLQISADLNRAFVWLHNSGTRPFDRYIDPTESNLLADDVIDAFHYLHEVWQESRVSSYPGGPGAPFAAGIGSVTFTLHTYIPSGETYEYSFGPNPRRGYGASENVTVGLAMSSQTEDVEATWRWMKFLATDASFDHIRLTGRPVAWGPAAREYQDHFPSGSEWEHVWIEILADPDGFERPILGTDVRSVLQNAMNQIARGEGAVGPIVEAAHAQIQAILNAR